VLRNTCKLFCNLRRPRNRLSRITNFIDATGTENTACSALSGSRQFIRFFSRHCLAGDFRRWAADPSMVRPIMTDLDCKYHPYQQPETKTIIDIRGDLLFVQTVRRFSSCMITPTVRRSPANGGLCEVLVVVGVDNQTHNCSHCQRG
jgi:hypothetical protein